MRCKSLWRVTRVSLVWIVVMTLSLDVVTACHLFYGHGSKSRCGAPIRCYSHVPRQVRTCDQYRSTEPTDVPANRGYGTHAPIDDRVPSSADLETPAMPNDEVMADDQPTGETDEDVFRDLDAEDNTIAEDDEEDFFEEETEITEESAVDDLVVEDDEAMEDEAADADVDLFGGDEEAVEDAADIDLFGGDEEAMEDEAEDANDVDDLFGDEGDDDLFDGVDADDEADEDGGEAGDDIDDLFNHVLPDPPDQQLVQQRQAYTGDDPADRALSVQSVLNTRGEFADTTVERTTVDVPVEMAGNEENGPVSAEATHREPDSPLLSDSSKSEGEHPLPMRQWVDNTGLYTTQARLVEIKEGSIRLLKETGRYSTVDWRRLSPNDRTYVLGVASQLHDDEELVARLVVR